MLARVGHAGGPRAPARLGGIVAGAVAAAASFAAMPYTGGVMNPARAFGPALAARLWGYQAVYWVGPLAGAVAAALDDFLFAAPGPRRSPLLGRAAAVRRDGLPLTVTSTSRLRGARL